MEIYHEKPILCQPWAFSVFQNNAVSPKLLVAPHWHEVYEVLFIRRGEGVQQINAATIHVSAGDVVVICPGDVHATETECPSGCDVDVIQFTAAALRGSEELFSCVLHAQDRSLLALFDALYSSKEDTRPGQQLRMNGLGQLLIGHLIAMDGRKTPQICSRMIQEVCTYLEHAPKLDLKQTADHFHYSTEHLSRKFRAETGISYRAYCEQIRMHRAIALLYSGETAVSALAETLGYSDSSSFIRAFKRVYGITPSLYGRLLLPLNENQRPEDK